MGSKILVIEIVKDDEGVHCTLLEKAERGVPYKVWEVIDEKGNVTLIFVKVFDLRSAGVVPGREKS